MPQNEGASINIRHIEAYEAIAATGSTIAAAAALQISQSNASRLLQQLETYLGVRLFDRDKNRLSPTPEGLRLRPDIRAIADRLQALKTTARELEAGRSGDILLRLAFPASLCSTALPRLVGQFRQQAPKARIEIMSGPHIAIERMIADGVADLGLVRLPTTTSGLKQQIILPSHHVCVMHQDHALALRASVTIVDLKGHDLIALNHERPARHELEALLYQAGLRQRPIIEAHSVACACALAAQNLGIAIVSAVLAQEFVTLPIRLVPLEPALPICYAIMSVDSKALPKTAEMVLPLLSNWASGNRF